jgi:hypothetical protein
MSDFMQHLLNNVTFMRPRMNQPYRWDSMFKNDDGNMGKYVACSADDDKAHWSISFEMDKAAATEFWNVAKAHFQNRNPKEKFAAIHSYRDLEDGLIQFTAKRNCKTKKGEFTEPPKMVDHNLEKLTDRAIWSGSKGDVNVTMLPTHNPSKKEWGISLMLTSVQVIEARYGGGDDLDGFKKATPPDNPMAVQDNPDNPYGLPDLPEQPAPSKPAITDDLDDEIPF